LLNSDARPEKIGGREMNKETSIMVLSYFLIVAVTTVLSTIIFIFMGVDPETSLSVVALLINNVGIGFRIVSPVDSFAFLSNFGLIFSSIIMILGRLEFLAILALMVPSFWRKNS